MLENRFGELFEESQVPPAPERVSASPPPRPQQFGPLTSVDRIYQAAYEQALRDHQLDVLFNLDYYGDHGSGI
jgi:hypothetical protein